MAAAGPSEAPSQAGPRVMEVRGRGSAGTAAGDPGTKVSRPVVAVDWMGWPWCSEEITLDRGRAEK